MSGWPYSAETTDLGWTDYLTLEELQALWSLTCVWRRDNEPDIGSATRFDEMMRLGVRKLTHECGYEWKGGLSVEEDLTVTASLAEPQNPAVVRGFLQHLATALTIPNFPWPNYETAFKATLGFLERELPGETWLASRVRDELGLIADAVRKARLTSIDEGEFLQGVRDAEERHQEFREMNRARMPRGVM